MKTVTLYLLLGLLPYAGLQSQNSCEGTISPTKQELRTNVTIPNTNLIKGYVEHVPADYWSSQNRFYPLVIFVHGRGDAGDGSANANGLCKLFNPVMNYPTAMIERGTWPSALVNANGREFPFITLSPQFSDWDYSEVAIGDFINYATQQYRVDTDRIYLIGASQGAEVIQKYVGSSDRNAQSIAAIIPIAACKYISNGIAQNIGRNKLGVWTSQCSSDLMCDANAALMNHANINNASTDKRAILSNFPEPGFPCLQDPHDTWSIMLDPNYKKTINGRSVNIYEFMISYSSGMVLPVQLANFEVSLRNGQPFLQWQTSQEQNGYLFYIERAREGEAFQRVDSLYTRNNPSGSSYEWTDAFPVNGKIQYRLSQVDKDGFIEYYPIKWITIATQSEIVVKQNPFYTQLNVEIFDATQHSLPIRIVDINGKILFQQAYQLNNGRISLAVNTEQWSRGLYIIQYGSKTRKVMKQ
ncbi:T9SS type A sorting domain-containing protein [Gynurincola endophyticus]|uniref:T9SS type A sorting domain-containing protein n=1 Tax=Gynurincola endophyticus TaxID=2479004 RepID=UPI001315AB04|nr:T9SS type A sorting domain-containing protein [Gynurincola endophyticus]